MKVKRKLFFNILVGIVIVFCVLTFYSTFSMDNNYKFESMVYDIEDNYIKNVSSNTSVELYYKYFDMEDCSIKVVDKNNDEIVSGFVSNGSKMVLYDNNHNIITSYTNVIKGDFNSDGIIDMNDYYGMGKCLVSDCDMNDYLKLSIDMDEDGEFHINDLMLLDKAVTLGYTGIEIEQESIILQSGEQGRLVGKVMPNYGVNLNVKWSSDDESIATVDDAGRVIGGNEGSTIVRATTLDGKYIAEAVVKVDNTIQLESYEGKGYVGGNDIVVGIKSIDYDDITCSVNNEDYASCEIKDKRLVLKAKNAGEVVVSVSSLKYGSVTYKFEAVSVYFNIMPKYLCMTPNSAQGITVSGFDTGDLTFEYSDNSIIAKAGMEYYGNRRMLRIDAGSKQGRATLKVTESNGNTSNVVTVDVYYVTIADFGKEGKIGEEVSTTILGDNLGVLSCKSSDESVGTCRIDGNRLIVTPLKKGEVTITVYNKFSYNNQLYDCGNATFMVVVLE